MGGRCCFASPNLLAVRGAGQSKAGQDRADRDKLRQWMESGGGAARQIRFGGRQTDRHS